jgi:hypothetical protein
VQHTNTDDNNFLADKLRAIRADLVEKKVAQGELLADDVPIGASDYFVRVLAPQTGQVVAQRPQMGGRALPPSVFPSSPADGQIPAQGADYKTSGGKWFLLMSALVELIRPRRNRSFSRSHRTHSTSMFSSIKGTAPAVGIRRKLNYLIISELNPADMKKFEDQLRDPTE